MSAATAQRLHTPASLPPASSTRRAPAWVITIFLLCAVAYLGLFLDAITSSDDDLLQGLTVIPILIALTLPFAIKIARTDGDRSLVGIVMAGAAVKILFGFVRYRVAYDVYRGKTDAKLYHDAGVFLAPSFRHFDFSPDIGPLTSTGAVKLLTGVVYAIFGSGEIVGYFVFAWLGFVGLLLFSRAFRVGVPNGDSRRYLIAVLFLPSLLYWPSAIGKEAPMVLLLGLCSYGVACMFRRRSNGVIVFAIGLLAILAMRPHLSVIVFAGVAFAAIVQKRPVRQYSSAMFRFLGVVALIVLGLYLVSQTQSFLDEKLGTAGTGASLTDQLSETQTRTTEAGSSFSPVTVSSPLDVPLAAVTVLFRPFPFETSNAQGLLTAAESMFTLGLLAFSFRRLRSVPRMIRTTPYLAYALGYLFAFVVAFSAFANFGILARQRSQALPLLLVLVALPKFQDLLSADDVTAEDSVRDDGPPARPSRATRPQLTGTRRRRRPVTSGTQRVAVSSGTAFAAPPRGSSG